MLEYPLARLESQVQAVEFGVAGLEQIDHPQALEVVLEALAIRADLQQAVVERVLSGMAERRVPDIVSQCDGFDQVFMQTQRSGDRAGNLRHLERVRHAGAKQVAFVVEEDLRLVDQPAKRGAVHDAIAIALERIATRRVGLGVPAAATAIRMAGKRRQQTAVADVHAQCASMASATSASSARCKLARPGASISTKRICPDSDFLSTRINSR